MKLRFKFEKSTKNTHRFVEQTEGQPPKVGTIYVQKWAFSKVPQELEVTIEGGA